MPLFKVLTDSGKKKEYLSPFIKKVEQLQWKSCILHTDFVKGFSFLLIPDKTGFFLLHSYQIGLPTLFPLQFTQKRISCLRKDHESGEENSFFRFPPPRLISIFSAGIVFPRSLNFVHIMVGTFLEK